MKFHDPEWMVWRVLSEDRVSGQALLSEKNTSGDLALTFGNLLTALLFGYTRSAEYEVGPKHVETAVLDRGPFAGKTVQYSWRMTVRSVERPQ